MVTSKTYIIFFIWSNTAKNHAGMAYLVKSIHKNYNKNVTLIEIPSEINQWKKNLKKLFFYYIVIRLKVFLKENDKVLFMEYLGNVSGNQTGMAIKLRELGVKNKFIGLVHLSEANLLELYGSKGYIEKGAKAVDKIIVFGGKLAEYFQKIGNGNNVITTFHYADTDYYKPLINKELSTFRVIHMGSLKRNFNLLRDIINSCPGIEFNICQGNADLSTYFRGIKNVKLYRYLKECELLSLMQSCDVSLSVIFDTVGSNVITTSMACGLVNVVSDVGSVRDYCNSNNSILCKSTDDFITALNLLSSDKKLLKKLSNEALNSSCKYSLERSIEFFYKTIIGEDYI